MADQAAQVAEQWTHLGSSDPMWAALTEPGTAGRWGREAFLETGRREIDAALSLLEHRGVTPRRGVALDFGCGPGRLTAALVASGFERVLGVDVSPTMLSKAREIVPPDLAHRCEFILNEGPTLSRLPSRSVDFVYSCRVLQHMPPEMAHGYIGEFLRVATDDGVVVFQIPSAPTHAISGLALRALPPGLMNSLRKGMQMHGTPPPCITRLIAEVGGRTISIEEDGSAGPRWRSYLYVTQRNGR